MTAENPYLDTLRRLDGPAAELTNELVVQTTALADELAAFGGTVARGEEALQRFDAQLDRVLATALAVIAAGSSDQQRIVTLALELLAGAAAGTPRGHTPVALAVLARAALTVTAGALAWRRLETVAQLAAVTRSDGYGPPLSVLADSELRHLDLYDRGADTAFQAHLAWFTIRPWRETVGVLSSDEQLRLAFAEADVLCGMLAVGEGRDRDLYAAGLTIGDRRVEDRIVARARDPEQRATLCRLFGVAAERLDERMSEAYAGLTTGGRITSRSRGLFDPE